MANPPNEYTIGQPVILKGILQAGDPLADIDPDTATLEVRSPGDTVLFATKSWPGDLEHPSTGHFQATITPTKSGRWWYRFESTGTGGAGETSFFVSSSRF